MVSDYSKFKTVCRLLEDSNFNKTKLISILQAIQKEYEYLPEEILAFIASALNTSLAKVYGVATFFAHFTLKPKGKYIIRVCNGTACHVKKSAVLIDAVKNKLKLKENDDSTEDMLFTIETVSCLGACGIAPVLVIGEDVHGQMSHDKVIGLIDEILIREKAE
jgi:NADH-quinone oxidoreductase subunit E